MRIVIIHNTDYGHRFVEHLAGQSPPGWSIVDYKFTAALPPVIDDPEEHIPKDLPRGDLLLYVGQDRKLSELVSDLAQACQVKAVIAAVDNRTYLPAGLANQIRRRLNKVGVPVVFPAPFCSLRETDAESPLIKEFARHFGRPVLALTLSEGRVKKAELIRGTPCGNTRFVAEKLAGVKIEDCVEETSRLFHAHPCMASMDMDREIGDTILHVAGHLVLDAVKRQLTPGETD